MPENSVSNVSAYLVGNNYEISVYVYPRIVTAPINIAVYDRVLYDKNPTAPRAVIHLSLNVDELAKLLVKHMFFPPPETCPVQLTEDTDKEGNP